MPLCIDGMDFHIIEPTPFLAKWFSHKLNHASLRYEVGIAIHMGWIVWINGPFPCGKWSNLHIMRESIIYSLDHSEFLMGDWGYMDNNNFTITPTGERGIVNIMHSRSQARHETCNGHFKTWGILRQVFRHNLLKHGACFRAMANIIQLSIQNGEPFFSVKYGEWIQSN